MAKNRTPKKNVAIKSKLVWPEKKIVKRLGMTDEEFLLHIINKYNLRHKFKHYSTK